MKATITNLNPVEITYPVKPKNSDYSLGHSLSLSQLNEYNIDLKHWQFTKKTARVVNAANILGYKIVKGQKKFKSLSLGMTVEFEPEKRMIIKI